MMAFFFYYALVLTLFQRSMSKGWYKLEMQFNQRVQTEKKRKQNSWMVYYYDKNNSIGEIERRNDCNQLF